MFLFAEMNIYEAAKSLFDNNVINWLVLAAALIYLWNKHAPPMFKAREDTINAALQDAALAKKQGEEILIEQRKKIANAEEDAKKILADARAIADEMQQQLALQTEKEIADLESKIEQQIATERQLAILQLREAAARAAISLTEKILPSLLDESAKARLLTQFMEQLDKEAGSGTTFRAQSLESINR